MRALPIIRATSRQDWEHLLISKNAPVSEFGTSVFTPTDARMAPLIIYEFKNELSDIIIQNLSIAMNARLISTTVNASYDDRAVLDYFYKIEELGQTDVSLKLALENKLESIFNPFIMENTDIELASSVTYITSNIPAGSCIKNVPSCHLSFAKIGHQISHIVIHNYRRKYSISSAIIIDPGFTGTDESDEALGFLRKYNCIIRKYLGGKAIANDIMMAMECLPFDFCLISTHCGEVSGLEQEFEFKAKDGKVHRIRGIFSHSFAPHYDKDEMVTVQTICVPISVDNVAWEDKLALEKIDGGNILMEFSYRRDTKLINSKKVSRAPYSQALRMYDQNLMLRPQGFSPDAMPIFINNSCFSAYGMADYFMFAGAVTYIGTLKSIHSWIAAEFIRKLFEQDINLPISTMVWLTQKQLFYDQKYFPYIYYGLPFTSLKFVEADSMKIRHLDRLRGSLLRTLNGIDKYDNKFVKDRMKEQTKFLQNEIEKFTSL